MKFAVVILTKNRDEYLKEALKSACNQKLKPSRIVVIDNAGSTKTKKIVSKIYLYNVKKDLKKIKHDMIITNIKRVDGKIKSKFTFFNDETFFMIKDFLNKNPGTLCSNLIVKKKTFISLGGFDKNVSGSCDKDLVMKFLIKDKSIFYNKKYHVFYRMHVAQWSRFPLKVINQRILFYKKYFRFFSLYDHLKFFAITLNISIRIFYNKFRYNSI